MSWLISIANHDQTDVTRALLHPVFENRTSKSKYCSIRAAQPADMQTSKKDQID